MEILHVQKFIAYNKSTLIRIYIQLQDLDVLP